MSRREQLIQDWCRLQVDEAHAHSLHKEQLTEREARLDAQLASQERHTEAPGAELARLEEELATLHSQATLEVRRLRERLDEHPGKDGDWLSAVSINPWAAWLERQLVSRGLSFDEQADWSSYLGRSGVIEEAMTSLVVPVLDMANQLERERVDRSSDRQAEAEALRVELDRGAREQARRMEALGYGQVLDDLPDPLIPQDPEALATVEQVLRLAEQRLASFRALAELEPEVLGVLA